MDYTFKNISSFGVVLKDKGKELLISPGEEFSFKDKEELSKYLPDITVFLGTKLEQVKATSVREVTSPIEVLVESEVVEEVTKAEVKAIEEPAIEVSEPKKRQRRRKNEMIVS